RAATGRGLIVKVEGGYHGWHGDVGASVKPDLERAGDVHRPVAVPNSAGILPELLSSIVVVTVNDREALANVFAEHGDHIAGLVIEPVVYSAGCVTVDQE